MKRNPNYIKIAIVDAIFDLESDWYRNPRSNSDDLESELSTIPFGNPNHLSLSPSLTLLKIWSSHFLQFGALNSVLGTCCPFHNGNFVDKSWAFSGLVTTHLSSNIYDFFGKKFLSFFENLNLIVMFSTSGKEKKSWLHLTSFEGENFLDILTSWSTFFRP